MIRVAIADDHPELRLALRLLLARAKNIEVVCEASNGPEAVTCVRSQQPDVLVMDVDMPELNGFAAAEQITTLPTTTQIILISLHRGEAYRQKAATIGARGFVPKDKLVSSLLTAIEAVHRGQTYFLD